MTHATGHDPSSTSTSSGMVFSLLGPLDSLALCAPYAGRSPLRGLPPFTVETRVRGVSRALPSSIPSALRFAGEAVFEDEVWRKHSGAQM